MCAMHMCMFCMLSCCQQSDAECCAACVMHCFFALFSIHFKERDPHITCELVHVAYNFWHYLSASSHIILVGPGVGELCIHSLLTDSREVGI